MTISLTESEINHLLWLIWENKDVNQTYYAPEEQFVNRQNRIEKKLLKAIYNKD